MKTLVLLRGLPGAGKSTLAALISEHNVAADDYLDMYSNGEFNWRLLKAAHKWCEDVTEKWMQEQVPVVAVHNTMVRLRDMTAYFDLAEKYGYRVTTIIVENRHGSESVHNVPPETILKMKNRFSIDL